MVPLGLSMALTVRVGEAHGAEEPQRLSPIVRSGWFLLLVYGMIAAGIFLLFGREMALAFTPSTEVVGIAASMLIIVGVFQVFDGLQVGSSAMLRGLHALVGTMLELPKPILVAARGQGQGGIVADAGTGAGDKNGFAHGLDFLDLTAVMQRT